VGILNKEFIIPASTLTLTFRMHMNTPNAPLKGDYSAIALGCGNRLMSIVYNIRRRFIAASLLFLTILFLTLNQSAWAASSPAPAAKAAPVPAALAKTCRVGTYLLSLRDFKPVERTFGADFWVWSVCPSADLKPLKSMEIINGAETQTAYESEQTKKDTVGAFKSLDKVYWTQQKVSTTLRHNWNLSNFPFDRHILEIPLEESTLDTASFTYTADTEASTYKHNLRLPGWRITSFQIKARTTNYQSTFGDPGLKTGESDYSRLSIFIGIQRDSVISFFKLITGVYAAFATVLLAFFLESGGEFGSRTGLLVGSLFAVLVSMQGIESVLGSSSAFTMVDAIHITTLGYIMVAVIAAVYSRVLYERGREKEALKFDRRICFGMFSISFSILNIVLVANALIRG
jgi:hypothetical protein